MPRYIALARRPRAAWDDSEPMLPQITVYEEPQTVDIGLVDAHGIKIYRVRDRVKMGFE